MFKVVSSCDVDSCSGGEKSEGDIKTNMSAPRDTGHGHAPSSAQVRINPG